MILALCLKGNNLIVEMRMTPNCSIPSGPNFQKAYLESSYQTQPLMLLDSFQQGALVKQSV